MRGVRQPTQTGSRRSRSTPSDRTANSRSPRSSDPIATPPAAFGSGAVCAGAEPTTHVPALDGGQLATRPLELQGTGDPQTPYGLYHGMSDPMGSTVVTVHGPGHGHVGLGNDAAEALVAHYLLTGEVATTDLPGLHT